MSTSKPKVLIIDDDPFISEIFVLSLKKRGMAVASASDGKTGLELVKKDPPDLILLDIVMPATDGYAVLTQLQSDPTTVSIPVVMLSNLAQPEDIERAKKAGASGFLKKHESPPAEVAEKVYKMIRSAQSAKP